MSSGSSTNYIMCWLYCDGTIINNSVTGYAYDKDPIRFVKLLFNLNFRGLIDFLYAKLFIDPNLYNLKVLRRVLNCSTDKFGVAPIVNDDDVEYMFESLDCSGSKVHVELYVEKVPIDFAQNSNDMVEGSKIGESSENTSTSQNSKSVQWGENISSGSSSRSLYMSRVDSEGNSRGSNEFGDDDIPYYRSFDGSSMVISYQEPIMQKVVKFKRVFSAFQSCIDAFSHCIPVLQIDGTHLYGKYRGVLLTATSIDGFYHLPVAFAIVEGESIETWTWFMKRVRRIVALKRTGVCVISDRHVGIISAMNNPAIVMQYTSFIDDCYKLEHARKVYAGHFHPIPKQSDWPLFIDFPLVMHDDDENISRKTGCRKETRYKN
ncbi:hypothetical protein POM88_007157 [Heracleum sosnowskyi]|uniref:MULE transposase domain-containing protein n=1 Tax=Heracleum sosnowskyi TaxID=360622 RepID=A0AAD8N5D1_9APIA|nr:hypothetical protein POM88_007116 [Heracleum sosnowskyi]KAK1397294.1 hypothetical protein POM88_007157 [Heracleum sosnowskyi]